MKTLCSLLFFFIMYKGTTQERTITGTVKNEQSMPVEFANIIISTVATPGNTITYAISNELGIFSFRINNSARQIKAAVSAIGYKALTVTVSLDSNKTLEFKMEPDSQTLKEVIVTSAREGDTLKLGIDSMNLTSESTLRDILNKTEGVMVTKDGAISFNGKQIAKILINGKEVFINQNKVALDNLNYEIMDGVQILNNYKDKFNIDFNTLSTPVINIKTKAKFKGVYKFNAELGLGYKNAYKIKGKAFLFSDNVNMFLTSNTNNVSEKDFSFKDVSPQIIENASVFSRNSLLPFFVEDNLLEKDFNSNNNLTLRKQTDHSKMGMVLQYANSNTKRSSATTVSTTDTIIKQGNYRSAQHGNLLTAILNYSHLFTRKTVLNNYTAAGFISQDSHSGNEAVNFTPRPIFTNELVSNSPGVFVVANNLKLTSLLSKKILMNTGVHYFMERSNNNFSTLLAGFTNDDIQQRIRLNKQVVNLFTDMAYRYNHRLSLRAGLGYTWTKETGSIKYPGNPGFQKNTGRTLNNYNASIGLQGEGKKIEYSAYFMPMYFNLLNHSSGNKIYNKASAFVNYKFTYRENIMLRYTRDVTLFDLNSSYDTIVQSYNYKIFNAPSLRYNISRNNLFDIGYNHSNVAKSEAVNVKYTYEGNKNFVQPIFDTLADNIFYYRNLVVKSRERHTVGLGGRKGFYLPPKYHKIEFIAGASYSAEKFPTVSKQSIQQYRSRVWQGNVEAGVLLQVFMVKELRIGVRGLWQQLFLDKTSINRQSSITSYFSLAGNTNKTEWKLTLEDAYYKTPTNSFHIPVCDLLFRYKVTEKLSFALAGKSLFNVFSIADTNNSAVNTFSDGNLVIQTINTSRIGYLMLNTIYKF